MFGSLKLPACLIRKTMFIFTPVIFDGLIYLWCGMKINIDKLSAKVNSETAPIGLLQCVPGSPIATDWNGLSPSSR